MVDVTVRRKNILARGEMGVKCGKRVTGYCGRLQRSQQLADHPYHMNRSQQGMRSGLIATTQEDSRVIDEMVVESAW
jgi:hypothetical protein